MRYPETREESAALLRLAVGHLGHHDAAPHPISFALWYEYAAGTNPRLSAAVDAALAVEPRLSESTVRQLYHQHVAELDAVTAERLGQQLQRMLQGMNESAAHTGRTAGSFGEQLDGLSRVLRDAKPEALLPTLGEALAGTAQMRSSVDRLQQRLSSSQREMLELRQALERSRQDATVDPLTRIPNRRSFDAVLGALADEPPAAGCRHVLALLDIDHFKHVNDGHGHLVGDSVLQGLGEILRRAAQAEGMSCARYGGEEFALVMRSTTLPAALTTLETVCAQVREMTVRQRGTREVLTRVTVSVGVAAWQSGATPADLVACADAALYRAKAAGRDRIMVA